MFLEKLIEKLILAKGRLIEPKPTRTLLHKTMNYNTYLIFVTSGFLCTCLENNTKVTKELKLQ